MGKVYISAIEAGIDTDEVTARPSDVLVGKTTIDDEGEVVSGSMPDNSTRTSNGNVAGVASDYTNIPTRQADFSIASTTTDRNKVFNMSPPKGYYPGNGQSYVNVPLSTFGNARQNQVLSGSSFTSENGFKISGTVPRMSNDMQSTLHGPVGSSHYRVHLPSNGYYENNDNRPSVLVDLEQICNNLGVDTSKMLDTLQIGNRRGTIPFHSYEKYADNLWIDNNVNEVFISFPEGCYKKVEPGNQWTPRIRIPLNTCLQKLGIGPKVAFNGATFDGNLISGVADKRIETTTGEGTTFYSGSNVNLRRYTMDSGNGMRFDVAVSNLTSRTTYYAGAFFSNSIYLYPFRKIKIGYKVQAYGRSYSHSFTCDISLNVFLLNTDMTTIQNSINSYQGDLNGLYIFSESFIPEVGTTELEESKNGVQYFKELDISGYTGQYFVGFGASGGTDTNASTGYATIWVNYIEFI